MPPAIPIATYRLQLTKSFGFDHAAALVPYLQTLGISHLYASPFLKARACSSHGYDVVDHNAFNPELGGEDAFAGGFVVFGSLVLLTVNIPFKTQAASVYIFGRVQTSDYSGAAAVSVLLLAIAVGVLLAINFFALWRTRHQRA